jgi:hypothetical protein
MEYQDAVKSCAHTEEVKSTKKAAIMTPIENLYGRVEARQTSLEWSQADGQVQRQVAAYSLRPRLGTKMFNGRLDTYVETPVSSAARTSNFEQKQSVWVSTFNALETDHISITPYHESMLPHQNSPFSTTVALNVDAFTSLKTTMGEFTVHAGIEPKFTTGTRETMTNRVNREPGKIYSTLAPKKDGTTEIKQQEPDTAIEYIGGVAFVPSFAPKFRLSTDVYFDRLFHPVYNATSDQNGERLEKAGYAYEDSTLTDVVLSYKADSLTTIQNRTLIFHDGLYAANYKGKSTPRIQNRLSLIYKLF